MIFKSLAKEQWLILPNGQFAEIINVFDKINGDIECVAREANGRVHEFVFKKYWAGGILLPNFKRYF
jgi:hypothetical protein